MSLDKTLLSRLTHPADGLRLVFGDAKPLQIHRAEKDLSIGLTLLSRFTVPANGLGFILGHTIAFRISHTEVDLSHRITLLGGFAKCWHRQAIPAFGLRVILRYP